MLEQHFRLIYYVSNIAEEAVLLKKKPFCQHKLKPGTLSYLLNKQSPTVAYHKLTSFHFVIEVIPLCTHYTEVKLTLNHRKMQV